MIIAFQICSSTARMGLEAPVVGVGFSSLCTYLHRFLVCIPPIITVLAFVFMSLWLRQIHKLSLLLLLF